ncbi:OmpA/MotB family protein [Scatolibacter rhodanostii]|uniref:OmpA/MotB family protein n=1 Tax=Scatolibacter rhodanostii TaxID=2014781 RepID=UPI000C07A286|nr:flagellar motor protein MotB [Scatolibacter rhodanostii]
MRKQRDDGEGGDSWLNTYADMVTLLLTFFAVLLSMSSTDEGKFNAFIKSFSNLSPEVIEQITNPSSDAVADSDLVITDMEELFKLLNNYVHESNQESQIQLSVDSGIIYIRFSTTLFFEPDEYVLRQESLPVLDFISGGLKQYEEKIRMVNVIGYTATVPNGTSYWMLSGERAATVATYFNNKSNFDAEKLTVMGYGNQYPVSENDTEAGRRKNRRVELVIIGNESSADFNMEDVLGAFYDNKAYPATGSVKDIILPESSLPKSE